MDSKLKSNLELVDSLGRFRNWVLPAGVMRTLIGRGPDATQEIRQRLDSYLESTPQGIEANNREAFFCYHLLGIDPDPKLRDWLGQFLRGDSKKIDACSGEITQSFTRALLSAIADRDDLPAFCQWVDSLVQDDQVYIYAKANALAAMFNLVGEGALDDSVAVAWIRTWLENRQTIEQDRWSAVIIAELIDIGGKDLRDLALECFNRNQVDEDYVDTDSLEGMSDDRQIDLLRKRARSDRAILTDPIAYLEPWHCFAWTTDSFDTQSATHARLPNASLFAPRQPAKSEADQWLAAIDKSKYETYPTLEIDKLKRHTDFVAQPLVERVRQGIELTKQGSPIDSNGPYLAATLLAHNTDRREVLFEDSELFLEILDLTSQERFEWFGDSIDSHLVEALAHILVGQSEPILKRILEGDRNDVERADLIVFFPVSVYYGYMSRAECIGVLRRLWEEFGRIEQDKGPASLLSMGVIADATCLLAMPEDDPMVQNIREEQIEYIALNEELAKKCRASQTEARKLMHSLYLSPFHVKEVIEQSGQFDDEAISPRPQQVAPLIPPPAPQRSVTTIRNESPRVGRNDPCPCGSGKKFKKCCI